MSWILASIYATLLSRLVNCETSAQVWRILDLYFATQIHKVTQLHNTKKGDLTINEYLPKNRSTVDPLALVSHKLIVKYHIDAIFEGLS